MFKNPFEKFADKLLHRDKKNQDLRQYSIDLSSVLGDDINYEQIQYNEHRKLVGLAKTCLSSQLHFWLSKKTGEHTGMIRSIERHIKEAAVLSIRIENKNYNTDDIAKLRSILRIYGCI